MQTLYSVVEDLVKNFEEKAHLYPKMISTFQQTTFLWLDRFQDRPSPRAFFTSPTQRYGICQRRSAIRTLKVAYGSTPTRANICTTVRTRDDKKKNVHGT